MWDQYGKSMLNGIYEKNNGEMCNNVKTSSNHILFSTTSNFHTARLLFREIVNFYLNTLGKRRSKLKSEPIWRSQGLNVMSPVNTRRRMYSKTIKSVILPAAKTWFFQAKQSLTNDRTHRIFSFETFSEQPVDKCRVELLFQTNGRPNGWKPTISCIGLFWEFSWIAHI